MKAIQKRKRRERKRRKTTIHLIKNSARREKILEREARERKELFKRLERKRKKSRDRAQIEKDKKEKVQHERELLIQISEEKEAKEREELNLGMADELKRANNHHFKDIKRLTNLILFCKIVA